MDTCELPVDKWLVVKYHSSRVSALVSTHASREDAEAQRDKLNKELTAPSYGACLLVDACPRIESPTRAVAPQTSTVNPLIRPLRLPCNSSSCSPHIFKARTQCLVPGRPCRPILNDDTDCRARGVDKAYGPNGTSSARGREATRSCQSQDEDRPQALPGIANNYTDAAEHDRPAPKSGRDHSFRTASSVNICLPLREDLGVVVH